MKNPISKFLLIGAVSLGFAGHISQADAHNVDFEHHATLQSQELPQNLNIDYHTNDNIKKIISQNLSDAIKKNIALGFLTQDVDLHINVVDSVKTLKEKAAIQKIENERQAAEYMKNWESENQAVLAEQAAYDKEHPEMLTENLPQEIQDAVSHNDNNPTQIATSSHAVPNFAYSDPEPTVKFTENKASMNRAGCHVDVSFDDEGNVVGLTGEKDTLKLTSLQNDNQRKMAQQFVTLHEQYHCEFATINEPVQIKSKNAEFNKKMNYLFKEQVTAEIFSVVSYSDILNENFADVSAALSLVKQYGTNDKDLNYVLNAMQTQRHDSYFKNQLDSHFTHFSLEDALSKETTNKLQNVNDGKTFQALALDIANQGTQKVLTNRPELLDVVTSQKTLDFGIYINTIRIINFESLSADKQKTGSLHVFKEGSDNKMTNGLSFDIAQDVMKNIDIKALGYVTPEGQIVDDGWVTRVENFVSKNKSAKMSDSHSQSYGNYTQLINEFKTTLQDSPKSNFDFIKSPLEKEAIQNKILALRNSFTNNVANNKLSLN